MENIILAIILICAGIYVFVRFKRMFNKPKEEAAGCAGCGGCSGGTKNSQKTIEKL